MSKIRSKVPTLRKALKSEAEMAYWNNYIASKIGLPDPMLLWKVEPEARRFNNLYRKEYLDKPVNIYCDALANYINLLGVRDL